MSNRVDVSIIIPVFNSDKYLDALLTSLLMQTTPTLEIIAVDDGSTDNSLILLQAWAKKDTRIRVLVQANQGMSVARNTGIQAAHGEWLTFVDSDDWVVPGMLSHWLALAREKQLELLIGNGFTFHHAPSGEVRLPLLTRQPWGRVITDRQWIIGCVENREWPHVVWLQLIRRDIVTHHGLAFIPSLYHEDILWTAHLALCVSRVGLCKQPGYGYRIGNQESVTRNAAPEVLIHRAESYLTLIHKLVTLAHSQTSDNALQSALLTHARTECRHFQGLLRKKSLPSGVRRRLARDFIEYRLYALFFRPLHHPGDLWFAIRFAVTLLASLWRR